MPPKIDLPAAWRGEELFARDDWTVELSESDLAELDAALESSLIRSGSGLANRLSSLQNSLERGGGATRVRGFPIDRYDEAQARTLFRAICERVGTPTQSGVCVLFVPRVRFSYICVCIVICATVRDNTHTNEGGDATWKTPPPLYMHNAEVYRGGRYG